MAGPNYIVQPWTSGAGLISAGGDVNGRGGKSGTTLQIAAYRGHRGLVYFAAADWYRCSKVANTAGINIFCTGPSCFSIASLFLAYLLLGHLLSDQQSEVNACLLCLIMLPICIWTTIL